MTNLEYLENILEITISPMDFIAASKAQPDGFIVVDVRNAPQHLKKVKIAGAVEIPEKDIKNRLGDLSKDKVIVVYCWDIWCNLAKKASVELVKNGYTVKELTGGIAAWQSLNLPVTTL
ncbi:rhodanese-like domain-containing protein [Clostridium pasteurianum]|uniref:Rhodanese-related sulfurtransferase n=1 Tax=Clostridium pasteurianum BC1 TaxID=86416 RepID=R4K9Y2_CLOPA|nr:rhodanese-like domain-containing protein [Clostridium pasteurianum]AGK96450.1 Rhodanese-related sulfurtransferase [Clostridium pasteurianum BC1]